MSAQQPITVLAHWQVVDGALDEVLALVAELRAQSLAEPGCLGYDAYRSADAPNGLLLVERYRDQPALDAHRQTAHYEALVVQRIRPLLVTRQVELLQAHAPA